MASETTYSCDNCGVLLESKENEETPFLATKGSAKEHLIFNVRFGVDKLMGGERRYASNTANDQEQEFELCGECGRAAKRGFREALKLVEKKGRSLEGAD